MAYNGYHQYPGDGQWFMPPQALDAVANDYNIHPDLKNSEPWSNYRVYNTHPVADGTAPLPSARQCTPPDQYSSTCSSVRSPVGESDYGMENCPSTPPDELAMSPYPCDLWTTQFMPAPFHHTDFVKPGELNYYPDQIHAFGEEKNPEFPIRGLSMSTNDSTYDIGTNNQLDPVQMARHMSPSVHSPETKDEICIPDPEPIASYPPLPEAGDDGYVNEVPQEDDKASDEDYKPRGPRKHSSSSASRQSKHNKRPSNAAPVQQPVNKKTKLEPIASPAGHRPNKASIQGTRGNFPCKECPDNITFKDESTLQKHIKQQHTRPFVCVFNFAGCDSTFASKNEWKRHVASQHLLLNYWLCQQDGCAKLWNGSNPSSKATNPSRGRPSNSSQPSPNLPNGAIFNRKDLYTQHLRRMHIPLAIKKQVKQKKNVPEWEERIRVHQEEAHRLRCDLPDYMECPAMGCQFHFTGPNAWDERMEHVAKHLEQAAGGSEAPVVFGGPSDLTLMNWATRPDVAVVQADGKGRWRLHNPLKPGKSGQSLGGRSHHHSSAAASITNPYSEEDAPGEEE